MDWSPYSVTRITCSMFCIFAVSNGRMKLYAVALLLVHAFPYITADKGFLVSKWREWYLAMDVNHDGIISTADLEDTKKKYSELQHLDADKLNQSIQNYEDWWKECFVSNQTQISEDKFIGLYDRDYTANKTMFYNKIKNCMGTFYNLFDINEDGFLSEEEYFIAAKEHGHVNAKKNAEFFETYKPVNGLVPVKNFVTSWVDFLTSTNSSKLNLIKYEFETGA